MPRVNVTIAASDLLPPGVNAATVIHEDGTATLLYRWDLEPHERAMYVGNQLLKLNDTPVGELER